MEGQRLAVAEFAALERSTTGWLFMAGWSQGRTQGRMRTCGLADVGTMDGRTKFEDSYFRIFMKT